MANLTPGYAFGSTEQVTNSKLATLVSGGTVSSIVDADISSSAAITLSKINITAASINYDRLNLTGSVVNADINASAAIVDSKLATIATAGKVNASALTSLASTPSGAGVLPVANLGSGTANSGTILYGDQTYKTAPIPYTSYSAGALLLITSAASHSNNNTTPTKVKEIQIVRNGTISTTFTGTQAGQNGVTTSYQIYRNGSAVGTLRTLSAIGTNTWSEDIAGWTAGDLLQVYTNNNAGSATAAVTNLSLFASIPTVETVTLA